MMAEQDLPSNVQGDTLHLLWRVSADFYAVPGMLMLTLVGKDDTGTVTVKYAGSTCISVAAGEETGYTPPPDALERVETYAVQARAAAEQAGAAAERAQHMINDKIVDKASAWSSQRIVETLCPEFKGSGPVVSAALFKDSDIRTTLHFQPFQEGNGEPSPENVRPIKGRSNVILTHCGKNLVGPLEAGALTPADGKEIDNSQRTRSVHYIRVQPGRTYYVVKKSTTSTLWVLGYTSAKIGINLPSNSANEKTKLAVLGQTETEKTFKTTTDTWFIKVYWTGKGAEGDCAIYAQPQRTILPYQGNAYTVHIGQDIYGGTVDLQTGKGGKMFYKALDGSERWSEANTIGGATRFQIYNFGAVNTDTGISGNVLSNLYPTKTAEENYGKIRSIAIGVKGQLYIYDNDFSTVGEWKEYLAKRYRSGAPVTIACEMAAPIPFQLTSDQMVTLCAYGNGDIVYTDDPACNVTLDGYKDPKTEIKTLTERIAALESKATGI